MTTAESKLEVMDRYDCQSVLGRMATYRREFCRAVSKGDLLNSTLSDAQREHLNLIDSEVLLVRARLDCLEAAAASKS